MHVIVGSALASLESFASLPLVQPARVLGLAFGYIFALLAS
jgi:hypothetical protein